MQRRSITGAVVIRVAAASRLAVVSRAVPPGQAAVVPTSRRLVAMPVAAATTAVAVAIIAICLAGCIRAAIALAIAAAKRAAAVSRVAVVPPSRAVVAIPV